MANFNGLTFTVQPAVTGAGAVNTAALPAGTVIAGILDPASGVNHIFNPQTKGLPVVTGTDTAATWLPVIGPNGLVATTVDDEYWAPVPGSTAGPHNKFGQIQVNLVPAAKDVVDASSVMAYKVSPNALFLVASGTF